MATQVERPTLAGETSMELRELQKNSCALLGTSFLQVLRIALVSILVVSLGCASGSSDDDSGDDGGTNTPSGGEDSSFTIPLRTNSSGFAAAQFSLDAGATKFAVTAFPPSTSNQIRFTELSSSSGANYLLPGGQELSFADFFTPGVNAVNAPSRSLDPNLSSGATYTVSVEAVTSGGAPLADSEVNLVVTAKNDGSLSSGTLLINLFFVGEIGTDGTVREVVSRAIDEFRAIYSRIGISLDIRTFDIDGPLVLPNPFDGNAYYDSASRAVNTIGINIFVGGDVSTSSATGVLGVSGGIIAPPIPSSRSALAVGILPGAGADGVYSDEDIRILGETFAHESGHYAGLFHPVDFSGETASDTDPLTDTATCSSFTGCLANASLVRNLMFTTPVQSSQGTFVPQNELTAQQASVINRYVAVN